MRCCYCTKIAISSPARRILAPLDLNDEVANLHRHIEPLVAVLGGHLAPLDGVGIGSADEFIVVAGENLDRLRSEAGFAILCGVCPIPVSSGKTQTKGSPVLPGWFDITL
jgi:transposase